jgi:hypothetical protein
VPREREMSQDFPGGVDPQVSEYMRGMAAKRWAKGQAKQTMQEAMSGGEPHPLFPTEPGEPIPQIDWIGLARFEPMRGTIDCPRTFPAAELLSLEDISNMYGGGNYELRGRCSGSNGTPGPFVRRVRVHIDGPIIPFVAEDMQQQQQQGGGGGAPTAATDPMLMFLAMMKESAAESRAAGERQTAMLVAMFTQSSQQQSANMQAMASIMAAAMGAGSKGPNIAELLSAFGTLSAGQMSAITAMMPKPDTSDPIEKIGKLMEVAKAMKGDEDSLTALMGGFGQAAVGIAELERARKEGGAPAQQQQQQQQAEPAQQQQQSQAGQQSEPAHASANGAANGNGAASGVYARRGEAEGLSA